MLPPSSPTTNNTSFTVDYEVELADYDDTVDL